MTLRFFVVAINLLEHAVFIDAILFHRLSQIPQLHHAVALETKDMYYRRTGITGILLYMGMDRYKIAILQHAMDRKDLVRILGSVLFHRCQQGLPVAFEIGIVVTEVIRDVPVIGFLNVGPMTQVAGSPLLPASVLLLDHP